MNKIRSRAGETIAETLIALLVGTLAMMVLAGMISATKDIVETTEEKMNDYYEANSALETFEEASAAENNVVLTVKTDESTHTVTIPAEKIQYCENGELKKTVTAYRYVAASGGGSDDTSGDETGG